MNALDVKRTNHRENKDFLSANTDTRALTPRPQAQPMRLARNPKLTTTAGMADRSKSQA